MPSKQFAVTEQRYLYNLDGNNFGITDYNDYRNVPYMKEWKFKFYAQNNQEVTTTDLFGSNDWNVVESQWSDRDTKNLDKQVRGNLVPKGLYDNDVVGCWFIQGTNCANTDRLFHSYSEAKEYADTYFAGLANTDDLANMSSYYSFGDSWGEGLNGSSYNRGFKGSMENGILLLGVFHQ